MRIIVLAYHSNNINGCSYETNDHIALAEDLNLIAGMGVHIAPLSSALDMRNRGLKGNCVCITFDYGSWFDWHDIEHPLGPQRGFFSILEEASKSSPVHATSFVIVSPQARAELDKTCLIGSGWWGEEWWNDAASSGLMSIENHSWDHQHDLLASRVTTNPPGRFDNIYTWEDADKEVRVASDYLDHRLANRATSLFAYPYGQWSEYLVEEYFPLHRLNTEFALHLLRSHIQFLILTRRGCSAGSSVVITGNHQSN